MKPNNIIYLKISEENFYRTWVEFLAPFHKLTSRERDVMARIIAQYYKLKESIPDPDVLKEVLWSNTSRKDMRESLKMTPAHFQMILAALKKAGVLENGTINPRFLPHINQDTRFMLSIMFDWSSKQKPADAKQT